MKMLIWSQYFWPENFHINSVARALHERGIKVTVLTGKPNYPEGSVFPGYRAWGVVREKYEGIDVIRVPLFARGKGSPLGLALNYLSFVFSGYVFAPFALRDEKFDLIFVYAPSPLVQALPAIFTAWLKGAPLALWVQDLWPEALQSTGFIKNRGLLRIIEWVVRYIYRFSDAILVQSEAFRPAVGRLVGRKEKIQFFPNSAADVKATPPIGGAYAALNEEIARAFSIVFAGNIGHAQACETIVAAAEVLQHMPTIKFYLIGHGSMSDSIGTMIKTRNLSNVVMTGRVPPDEMASLYKSASVLLLSLRDDAAFSATVPSKLQGYLAAGKPIIVSSNGESAEVVVKAGAGIACPAQDAEALAQAVVGLQQMEPQCLTQLGENGRKFFLENYHLPARMTDLIARFEKIVGHS